ncbi:MAG TPA: glycosyltransferase [Myxococcales bacterium]|nr:glycosyltransferase [Myxococcales bacterium]HIM01998.1 glycosyltransferase [Myxococcales bacterium]
MKTLSIVVPVYYNEGSLRPLFDALVGVKAELAKRDVALQLIFVDDGSRDNSLQALLEIAEDGAIERDAIKIIKHSRNFGSMMALKTGFQFVEGDCFTVLTADLEDPPELVIQMVDQWLAGSKYVICARGEREGSFRSKLFASVYHRLVQLLVFEDYPRGGFDIMLMDRDLLPHLQKSGKNINLPILAHYLGFEPTVIQYHRMAREHGISRWTFRKRLKLFVDSLLGFSMVPLRLISITGLGIAGLAFLYGIAIVLLSLFGYAEFEGNRGFATIAALISFLLGLIIVMLGIIGEYVWRIFDEVNHRPEAVIDEIY